MTTNYQNMTLDCASFVASELESRGYTGRAYENYSGRAMYGKTCHGIVTDAGHGLVAELVTLYNENEERPVKIPGRQDSLGRDTIYY